MYLWYYRGKFGGCWQIPTHKNVSGSKLCWHDRGILAKCADIWLSGRHVANLLATLSAKVFYGTVSFCKKTSFKILAVLPHKMKAKPNCTPPFLLRVTHPWFMLLCDLPLDFMSEH
jgi:hypothetical protein